MAVLGYVFYEQSIYNAATASLNAGNTGPKMLPVDQREFSGKIFEHYTYYILMAMLVLFVAQIIIVLRNRQFNVRVFLARHWPELLSALLITVICFWSVPPRFRVLSDESNLLAVSQNMVHDRTVLNNVMSKFYFGNIQPVASEQHREKRPFLYCFLVHIFHLLRGYDISNAFLANAVTLFALLSLIGVIVQRTIGRLAAVAGMILVATYPLVCLCATSAGFDLLASFFLCLVLVETAIFMRNPAADTFALLWITALAFAHTRYESGIGFFLIVTALSILGYFQIEYFEPHWYQYAITPWLILPLILQRLLLGNQLENNTGTPDFSLDHFVAHTKELAGTLINFDRVIPYAPLLNMLALLFLVGVLVAIFTRKNSSNWHRPFFAICILTTVFFLVLYLSYYFGSSTHPASARFFVFFCIMAALMPVAFRYYYPTVFGDYALIAVALISATLYHSISVENRFTNTQTLIRQVDAAVTYLNKINDKRILIIADRPGTYTSLGYGSVDFTYANQHYGEIMAELNQGLYTVLVLQRVSYTTRWPVPGCQFNVPFDLKVVKELQFSGGDAPEGGEFLRISWVGGNMP
jgi:uncharacterized membrane protein YozB (DUF420 family)